MNRTAAAVLSAAALLTLTACSGDETAPEAKPSATAPAPTTTAAAPKSGLPPEPTGQVRADLLAALKTAAPETVRYEDKAVDAARNQCQAINGGASKLDWTASQRFTYKDVTTTETQGKAINEALKKSGFCTT
ncbi:hypothetical protein [Streptomyces sp. NBC_01268]|uniref:hypothetical protein n=1 Tax=Streptomyces sp. NBC_01268 TaxID=2903806 RepID=UPI002E336137|nr:hypothetical protein [Streptomyces sp. NBC_01268]